MFQRRRRTLWIQQAFLFLPLSLLLAAAGCGSGSTGITTSQKTLTSVAVSATNAAGIAVGATEQLTATATYSDGSTANVTATATWTSASVSVATVSAAGLATGVTAGSSTVTASVSGVSGIMSLTVTAAAKTLSSIAVTPLSGSIAVGATQQFTATGTYSDGSTANITTMTTWTTATVSVATISAAGIATGVAVGSTAVTATLSGVSGTAMLAVTAAPVTLTSIAVTPLTGSVIVGATQQFTATATYSNSTTANVTTTATWATASAAVATVNAAGLATGVAVGSTSVTATLSGVTGTAMLTVAAAPVTLTSIAVTPLAGSVAVGATQQFTAMATYSNSTTANVTTMATWSTSSGAIATVNAAGLAAGVAVGSTTVTATLTGVSASATLAVTTASQTLTSIAVTPNPASIAMGVTQQFTATATYSDKSTADVTSTVTWTAANTSVATIDASGLAMGVAAGSTTITATLNATTGSAPLTVTIAAGTGVNISTWHVDNNRSGLNAAELSLTPSNVSAQTFGKLFSYLVDGYVYGEPLLMSNIAIPSNGTHNVLYVATENDSVYAFDADNYGTGTPLWQVSLLQTGETPLTGSTVVPYQAITSTPVIDPTTNTMYVVSAQHSSTGTSFRLNALNILTGAQQTGSPVTITASVAGTNAGGNGTTVSLTTACIQRAALLLANGNVYIGMGGCQTGWLLAYTALTTTSTTMTQTAVFNSSPNLNGEGPYASAGGIWMGGGGPAADSQGNIYVATGNGPWDGQTAWGDSVLKFTPQLGVTATNSIATPTDYFTPDDYAYMNCQDADLAAGGLLLIPNAGEALAGGKTGELYLVNTASLGKESASDAGVTQELYFEPDLVNPYANMCTDSISYPYDTSGSITNLTHTAEVNSYENFGTAAYFNGAVYIGVTPTLPNIQAGVREFIYSGGTLTPGDYTAPSIGQSSYGTTPFISANGATNGIMWMIDHGDPLQETTTPSDATLRAYDATDLETELYSSSTNTADTPGYGIKFTSPIVANGKVYISTGHALTTATGPLGEIDVYGLH